MSERRAVACLDTVRDVRAALQEGIELRRELAATKAEAIADCAERIAAALDAGGKLLLCGNGGSAADCQHIAAELTSRFRATRAALAAISLTTDTSVLTAIANDFGFEEVFARQVEALGRAGDVLLAISTSGRSANVLQAARAARARGLLVVALTGAKPDALGELSDLVIAVPGTTADRIQELHITIGHVMCDLIERRCAGPR
jgi:D-sedoheptulose 7-phosphate isomerase